MTFKRETGIRRFTLADCRRHIVHQVSHTHRKDWNIVCFCWAPCCTSISAQRASLCSTFGQGHGTMWMNRVSFLTILKKREKTSDSKLRDFLKPSRAL